MSEERESNISAKVKKVTPKGGKRGGDVKKAPPGYYTASQAAKVLGLNPATFRYYVRRNKIPRVVPPMRVEGFYPQKEVDQLATELAMFLHATSEEQKPLTSETRPARPEDADGVVAVLTRMGWKTATAEQRQSWYKKNPYVDYVVLGVDTNSIAEQAKGLQVMGYINAAPYVPETMQAMLAGKKRSWMVTTDDIYAYESGGIYDVYIGIATRKEVDGHTQRFGFRLIAGFLALLKDLARQDILIRALYAASDQPDGMKLCKDLGFELLPREEGDLFNRYKLDLLTSDSLFARRYREALPTSPETY